MMNLKTETLHMLESNGKKKEDVKIVCGEDFQIPVELFWKLADTDYDYGIGGQEVASDLMLYGDDFFMERHEYDGYEWWEIKLFKIPDGLPFRTNITALTTRQADEHCCCWNTLKRMNKEGDDEQTAQ